MKEHIFTASSQADIVTSANTGTLVSPYLAKVGGDYQYYYDYNTISAPTVTFNKTAGAFQTVVPVTCNVPASGYGITTMDQTSWVRISTDSATTYADATAGILLESGVSTVYLILDGENTGDTAREQTIYFRFRPTPSATPEVLQEYTFTQDRIYSFAWKKHLAVEGTVQTYYTTYNNIHHIEVTDPNGNVASIVPDGTDSTKRYTAQTEGDYTIRWFLTGSSVPVNHLGNGQFVNALCLYYDVKTLAKNTVSGSTTIWGTGYDIEFGPDCVSFGTGCHKLAPATTATTLTFTGQRFGTIGTQAFYTLKTKAIEIHIPKGTRENYRTITNYFTKATIVEDEPESPGE